MDGADLGFLSGVVTNLFHIWPIFRTLVHNVLYLNKQFFCFVTSNHTARASPDVNTCG